MSREIGIDLGTANVLIHLKGRGIVLNEPAVIAVNRQSREVIAAGRKAYEMQGRTSDHIQVIHPLQGGVIADYDFAEALLVLLLKELPSRSWLARPKVLISAPSKVSDFQKQSLIDVVQKVTGGKIYIEEQILMAATGAGFDMNQSHGAMVIDIGGGTSDMAVLSGRDVLVNQSFEEAGQFFDQAIINYFSDHYQVLIGARTAEMVKINLATAIEVEDKLVESFEISGRSLLNGLPTSLNADSNDLYQALHSHLEILGQRAQRLLEDQSPEIAADIMEGGIILTGGGALISNLDTFLSNYLNVSVIQAEQPMNCVAIGTGLMLDLIESGKLSTVQVSRKQRLRQLFQRIMRRLIG
ncbi:rod shape-determining protein [Eremococcus coleocola]|uniref:Cell shape-determining protein MreB n=1 Tax=Eremococcus coleocola ACS-139-V-Col8 TaxID=908337 RepID=E4KP74_9LACT|nr:rod shape-determining protein [Eremococcus coleocola]EFR31072.1 cell shape determining protein, MreB/Mrl family [Eremococcus coleocola ACS-139-V-Col8]